MWLVIRELWEFINGKERQKKHVVGAVNTDNIKVDDDDFLIRKLMMLYTIVTGIHVARELVLHVSKYYEECKTLFRKG